MRKARGYLLDKEEEDALTFDTKALWGNLFGGLHPGKSAEELAELTDVWS